MKKDIEELHFKSDDLHLFGRLLKSPEPNLCIIFLHGGGYSNSYRFEPIQRSLYDNGVSSFAFDFRGCGNSEGEFEDGSLINRLGDAKAATSFVSEKIHLDPKNMVVSGGSMGGHIACRLLDTFNFKGIILQCPAAYSKESENVKLNEEFSKLIRIEYNWVNSPAFESLKNFKGKKYAFYGEDDTVIPESIKQKYKSLVGKKNFYLLKGGKHKLLAPENDAGKKALESLAESINMIVKNLQK